jgi:ABC-2 type transport system permease protein
VRHTFTIASREIRSLFVSPVAYVVLTLWSVIAGTFFLASLYGFHEQQFRLQQLQMLDRLETLNLNDQLIEPFIGSMWVIVLFLLPAITMGLVASEKANGTDELLLTGVEFVTLMTAIAGFFPMLLFFYGEPELGKTLSGMLCLWLVSVTYVAVGVFASSVTRNQLVAFIFTFVLLLILGMMLPFIVDISLSGSGVPSESPVAEVIRWMATGSHVDRMLQGLIDTSDLAYYVVASAIFLLLAKTVIESARWR